MDPEIFALTTQVLAHAKKGILDVLEGRTKEYSNPLLSPDHYADILKDLGAEQVEDDWPMETNGWAWDYWITYTYQDVDFIQNGSGYYANSSFRKKGNP